MNKQDVKFLVTGLLITLLIVICCIRLGHWQYHKAQIKQQLQLSMDDRLKAQAVTLPSDLTQAESLRYLKVEVVGEFVAQAQFLLDNQVYQDRAGFNVVTPFRVEDTQQVILVNRGWVMKDFSLGDAPNINVPQGKQTLQGYLWVPPVKTYQLAQASVDQTANTQIWQTLDMAAIAQQYHLPLAPLVLRLIEAEKNSGLIVDWPRPDDRIITHLGYAYQWYGFAFAAIVIFVVLCWRRRWNS